MTREEAIEMLKKDKEQRGNCFISNALDMAIEALEQEPCEDDYIKVPKKAMKYVTKGMVAYNYEWLREHFDIERLVVCGEQELCEDAISRQAVLDAIAANCIWENEYNLTSNRIKKAVEGLPSVNPQPKTGCWIPVSEKLPENVGFYLVSTTDCITIMEFCKGWISQNLGSCNGYVKAWMPLPKSYKGESEET